MLFFLASQLKKTLGLTNTEALSSAKHSAMCALGEGESLCGFAHTIVMPDLAAYHVEEDAATENNITAECG